ncbi:ABC transporter ATP-binding protein [Paenibacillus aurantius]|uniref:ABC transporter ATP-binding protein n=1 Tax=Paenibacillus aurantius TaxID=2918900 RepID=A0AA96RG43_9BACL|nr:ABC transporter ATP-binding protein [Paenibacillus aurantius]WNQ09674.1 ABC transporter ATP-binding protein [Paenibacillus aurantius]
MKREKSVFYHLLPYVKRFRWIYICLTAMLFAGIADGLLFTWFLQSITNGAIAGDVTKVQMFFLFGAGLVLVMMIVQFLNVYFESLATNKVKTSLADDLFDHLLRLPTRYYTSNHSGDMVARITQDVNSIGGAIGSNLINLIRQPLWAAAAFIYLVTIHWVLALLALMLGPATTLLAKLCGRLLRQNGQWIQQLTGKLTEFVTDSLAGHLIIRTFGLESDSSQNFKEQNGRILELQLMEGRHKAGLQAGTIGVSLAAQIVVIGVGSLMVIHKRISIGELIAFISLTQGLISPFTNIANTWGGFQRSLAAVERVFQVLKEPTALQTLPTGEGVEVPNITDGIRYKNIIFSYKNNHPLLNDFNLEIPAGKTVAFVGPSGSGKSTIFNLTLGLYEPNSGEIEVDGKKLNEDVNQMRKYMSLVPQESFLFSGTIRTNIALGKIGSSNHDIMEAAKAAQAHSFIMELPLGYETEVGEKGIRLSGGQKQRISIARAILRNAPILLLDEATSALDSESEISIQIALKALMHNRTTLVIAHRLSTILDSDLIVVMDKGRIVEMGEHQELIQRDGLYSKMFAIQFKEYTKFQKLKDV